MFDFDGTVVDTETPVFESWRRTYELNEVEPLSRTAWRAHIGTTSQPFHPLEELERRLVGAGKSVDLDRIAAQRQVLRDAMLDELRVRPGIEDWIETAERLNIGFAIASSSPAPWVHEQLTRLNLAARFSVVSCAGEGVPGKPDPAVYQIACERLAVAPERAIAIEDSPVGAEAAARAGLYVVVAPGPMTTGLRFAHADIEVSALSDLPARVWLEAK